MNQNVQVLKIYRIKRTVIQRYEGGSASSP